MIAFRHVDSAVLVYLRVVVGITIFIWVKSILDDDRYVFFFQQPRFLLKYPGFQWVALWPGEGIYWQFVMTLVASLCLVFGILTRLSALLLSGSLAYVLFVESSLYEPHLYFLSCLAGLLAFLPADRILSVDSRIGLAPNQPTMECWQLWLLRIQVGLPFVFRAIAKLNEDWLSGYHHRDAFDALATARIFAYCTVGCELFLIPLLLWWRTKWLGVLGALLLFLTDAIFVDIAVLPWCMFAALIVLFPADTATRLSRWFLGIRIGNQPVHSNELSGPSAISRYSIIAMVLGLIYVASQILLPMRHWVHPGPVRWNERGQRFSWGDGVHEKVTLSHFLVIDSATEEYLFVPSQTVLTENQTITAGRDPELMRQAAIELSEMAREMGTSKTRIYCLDLVSLEGRPPIPLVDPTVDLCSANPFNDGWIQMLPDRQPQSVGEMNDREGWWQSTEMPGPFTPLQGRTPKELQEYLQLMQQADAQKQKEPHGE